MEGFGRPDLPTAYIRIVRRCERRTRLGGWLPAFRLCIVDDGLLQVLPEFSTANRTLTFLTRAAAESWSEMRAREWCRKNYPGLPVRSNRTVHQRSP